MRKLIPILLLLLATGCVSGIAGNAAQNEAGSATTPIGSVKAIYLTRGQGELTTEDLKDHPEVVVIGTFDELKQHTSQKVALWIDRNVTPLVAEQEKWINEAPQGYYPIVLLGISDTLYAFRDFLGLCCFMGPGGDNSTSNGSGFSVIQREQTNEPEAPSITFLQGYDEKPTVEAVLEITNALLEGKPSPTVTSPSVPTATP